MSPPLLVLVGPPGAGKSTVGPLLAARLGVAFRDTDADVVEVAGKPIAEVFIDDGEEHFRALERAAVAAALTEHDGLLSLGGGAVLSPETRALKTIDTTTGQDAVAHHQRSDVCAVPAAGVVAEAMVALVLADVAVEKFGGDSVEEARRNCEAYLKGLAIR